MISLPRLKGKVCKHLFDRVKLAHRLRQSLPKFPSSMSKDNLQKSSSKTSNTSKKSVSNDSFSTTVKFADSNSFVPSFIIEDLEKICRTATQSAEEAQSPSHQSSVAAAAVAAVVIPADEAPSPDPASPSGSSDTTTSGLDEKDSDKDAKKKKNRCATCRKKVGLTGKHCNKFFLCVFR
uniref:AN1-type domain-containing protein n=1 Tax=Dendroctonus ponderosae TaxID=77166 RepID=A0AAR5QGZ3_DENPD